MSTDSLRVAFFPDAYNEVDGVANTSRQFAAYASRQGLPFLVVHGGSVDQQFVEGTVLRFQRKRSSIGFSLDKNHDFDLLFVRHYDFVARQIKEFKPDVIHITGPSDVGILGALVAYRLNIPLVASWHTNVHQYAERRSRPLLQILPATAADGVARLIGKGSFQLTARFYQIPRILFAPNRELIDLLEGATSKPCFPMSRGVDTALFTPNRRTRTDAAFVIGYVGRLTPEKSVMFLPELERALAKDGVENVRFLIVGQGSCYDTLRRVMKNADLPGVLRGEMLARAYASMDVFVFPSRTDVFGNVVLEALASGVPALVTDCGGPRFIVRDGETGFVVHSLEEFVTRIKTLACDPHGLAQMRQAARQYAETASWDEVFHSVYSRYPLALQQGTGAAQKPMTVKPVIA
jgi:phosphatidylinositol alpha 1,6-mannosyltransferase